MSPLRERVENESLHLDESAEPPGGAELELLVDDDGGDLTDKQGHALHMALPTPWSSAEAERSRPASALIDECCRSSRADHLCSVDVDQSSNVQKADGLLVFGPEAVRCPVSVR